MPGRRILLLILLWFPCAVFATGNAYLEELIQRARQENLSQRAEWLNLLHYKPYAYWFGQPQPCRRPRIFQRA